MDGSAICISFWVNAIFILGPFKIFLLRGSIYCFGFRGLFLGSEEWSPHWWCLNQFPLGLWVGIEPLCPTPAPHRGCPGLVLSFLGLSLLTGVKALRPSPSQCIRAKLVIGWLGGGLGPTASGVRGEGGMTGCQGKTCGCMQLCERARISVCVFWGQGLGLLGVMSA